MCVQEDYVAPHYKDGFIAKGILSFASILARFRLDDSRGSRYAPPTALALVGMCVSILMISLSNNFIFTAVFLAINLVRMCLLPSKHLARVLKPSLVAALIALTTTLPSIFLGQYASPVLITSKVFVTTSLVLLTSEAYPSHVLTASLRLLGVTNSVIFLFDLTLRNIVRLGEIARRMLEALSVRSIGHMRDKTLSLGGIAATLFFKANKAATEAHEAMVCRGFVGTYPTYRMHFSRKDLVISILYCTYLAALGALFIYTQGLV
jgi:cobalt/nickel transport system permease protein